MLPYPLREQARFIGWSSPARHCFIGPSSTDDRPTVGGSSVGSVASGGSVSIAQLAGLAVDFAPFGKILKRLENAGELTVKAKNLLQQIYRFTGKAEALGDAGALMAIRMKGFKSIGFVPGAKGIDDLVEDAAGNLIIVEAKGWASGLKRVAGGGQQMSQGWIRQKVEELADSGQGALARRLLDQAKSGQLKAMVVKTRTKGPKAFEPDIQLKDWNDIGKINWD